MPLEAQAVPVIPARTPEDIQTIERLAREIWRQHYLPIIGQGQIDYMLERFQSAAAIARQIEEGQDYFLLYHRGSAAGYLAIEADADAASLKITKIYVRKEARGLGLGKALLAFAEAQGRARDIHRLWLTVNKYNSDSIAWYEHMGFCNEGPVAQDIGGGFVMDDFRFGKTL